MFGSNTSEVEKRVFYFIKGLVQQKKPHFLEDDIDYLSLCGVANSIREGIVVLHNQNPPKIDGAYFQFGYITDKPATMLGYANTAYYLEKLLDSNKALEKLFFDTVTNYVNREIDGEMLRTATGAKVA